MSLRWSLYVALNSPKGGLKNAKRPISLKRALRLKKVCYKVSLCENCQRQSCKAFTGLTNRAEIIGGATPCTWNFGSKWPRWCKMADFLSIFARSASAVTPVWKLSRTKLWGIHWPNYPCKNDWWGTTPSTWNFESKWPRWSAIVSKKFR